MNRHEEYIVKYLDGSLEDAEMKEFEAWLAASPENQVLFIEMARMDSLLSSAVWHGEANPVAVEQIEISLGLAQTERKLQQMRILEGVRKHIYRAERKPVPVPIYLKINWRILIPAAAGFVFVAGLVMYQIVVSDIMKMQNSYASGTGSSMDSGKTEEAVESLSFEGNQKIHRNDLKQNAMEMFNLGKMSN